MDLQKLASVRIGVLLDELSRRIMRLEYDGNRLGNVGPARQLMREALDAGFSKGRADALLQFEARIVAVLDTATANTPEPPGPDAPVEQRLQLARDGRRALWSALETLRAQCRAEADAESGKATKARAWLEMRAAEVFTPVPRLRERLGRWLIVASERLARGAA